MDEIMKRTMEQKIQLMLMAQKIRLEKIQKGNAK